jgi:hypothetical protein
METLETTKIDSHIDELISTLGQREGKHDEAVHLIIRSLIPRCSSEIRYALNQTFNNTECLTNK